MPVVKVSVSVLESARNVTAVDKGGTTMARPFDGIRVSDWTMWQQGLVATIVKKRAAMVSFPVRFSPLLGSESYGGLV